jgi:hypothetical protein
MYTAAYRVYFGTTYYLVSAQNLPEAIKRGKNAYRGFMPHKNKKHHPVTKVEKLVRGKGVDRTVAVELTLPKSEEPDTVVIFRKWNKEGGEVIALFPEDPANMEDHLCNSYMHVGQHGSADPQLIFQQTLPAKSQEYKELLQELRRIGYRKLVVRQRLTQKMRQNRIFALKQLQVV